MTCNHEYSIGEVIQNFSLQSSLLVNSYFPVDSFNVSAVINSDMKTITMILQQDENVTANQRDTRKH